MSVYRTIGPTLVLKMQEKALGWGGGQLGGGGGVECEPSYLKLKTKVKVGAGEGVRWRGDVNQEV